MSDDSTIQTIEITASQAGERLDKALSALLPDISRSKIQSYIKDAFVSLDNVVIDNTKHTVQEGQICSIDIPKPKPVHMVSNDSIPLDIVFEDDHLMVINKQAGLSVHPGAGNQDETMANALLAHYEGQLSTLGGIMRPGIVHRLDKDTTGLIMVAKHDKAHELLSAAIARREVSRQYKAICFGVPKPFSGTIETYIDRHPSNRLKMAVYDEKGKHAITHYQVEEIFGKQEASLVNCQLETGRTHQIRVHFNHINYPIFGDPLYGKKQLSFRQHVPDDIRQQMGLVKRQALHAWSLSFMHPVEDKELSFEIPLPKDLENLVNLLKSLKK